MIEYGSDYLLGLASFAPEKLPSAIGCGRAAILAITLCPTRCSISAMWPFAILSLPTNIRPQFSCILTGRIPTDLVAPAKSQASNVGKRKYYGIAPGGWAIRT